MEVSLVWYTLGDPALLNLLIDQIHLEASLNEYFRANERLVIKERLQNPRGSSFRVSLSDKSKVREGFNSLMLFEYF